MKKNKDDISRTFTVFFHEKSNVLHFLKNHEYIFIKWMKNHEKFFMNFQKNVKRYFFFIENTAKKS